METPMPDRFVDFTDGDGPPVFRLTGLGAAAFLTSPLGELGYLVDLDAVENRPPSSGDHAGPPRKVTHRYLLSPGQAAELIMAVIRGAMNGGEAEALYEALEALK